MSYKIRVKNKEISSLKDWENAFNGGKLWKKGRSAYSLADFMLNRNGIKTITEILDRCGRNIRSVWILRHTIFIM